MDPELLDMYTEDLKDAVYGLPVKVSRVAGSPAWAVDFTWDGRDDPERIGVVIHGHDGQFHGLHFNSGSIDATGNSIRAALARVLNRQIDMVVGAS
jgi:hypothetical protein